MERDVSITLTLFVIGLAFFVTLIMTPLVAKFATVIDLVDRPDGHRKLHGRITPLGGGIAVILGYGAALGLIFLYCMQTSISGFEVRPFLGLLAATSVIVMIGFVDDKFGMRGRQKLFGQIVAALVAVAFGLSIETIDLFGYPIILGVLAVPFTVAWLVFTTNALNLIDGVDGLATTLGVIYCLALSLMALLTGHTFDALCGLALAGSLAGFAVFNLPPAKIFLGDTGSMLIGFTLGMLAIRSSLKGPTSFAMVAPCLVLAIPAFDVLMAILRRKLTGRSIYTTDRGHLHHVLQQLNFGPRRTVLFVGGLAAICSMAAVASVVRQNEWLAVIVLVTVLLSLVVTRTFGFHECQLLTKRVFRFTNSVLDFGKSESVSEPIIAQMNGNREWELLWTSLVDFSQDCGIRTIQFNVSAPSLGEEYHASWRSPERIPDGELLWKTEIPLFADKINVGQLVLSGRVSDGPTFQWLSELLEGLKPFEMQMRDLLEVDRLDVRDIKSPHNPLVLQEKQTTSTF